jgi:hypothetical protein
VPRQHHLSSFDLNHELINQLSTILGNCDLLLARGDDLPAEHVRRLRMIRETADKSAKKLAEHQQRITRRKAG